MHTQNFSSVNFSFIFRLLNLVVKRYRNIYIYFFFFFFNFPEQTHVLDMYKLQDFCIRQIFTLTDRARDVNIEFFSIVSITRIVSDASIDSYVYFYCIKGFVVSLDATNMT